MQNHLPHSDWLDALREEAHAFQRVKSSLMEQYEGRYVALYQGEVIASGDNEFDLLCQVHQQFGPIPCLIDRVDNTPPRVALMPSLWRSRSKPDAGRGR